MIRGAFFIGVLVGHMLIVMLVLREIEVIVRKKESV